VTKETKRPPRTRRRSPTDLAARLDALDYRRDDETSIEAHEFRVVSNKSGGFARGKLPVGNTVKLGSLLWSGIDDKTGENAALYEIDDKSPAPRDLEFPPDGMAKLEKHGLTYENGSKSNMIAVATANGAMTILLGHLAEGLMLVREKAAHLSPLTVKELMLASRL
jgi:hypothetical protein